MDCKCMEFVAASWCTMKWLRFYQTIRNFTSGDLRIPLVVTHWGVTKLKKTRSSIPQTLQEFSTRKKFLSNCRTCVCGLNVVSWSARPNFIAMA